MQPHPDVSGHEPLRALNVGVQVGRVGCEPEAVVDHIGILQGDAGLGAGLVFGQRHCFQRRVGCVQQRSGRAFVDLSGFDAHQTVLHMVDSPDAVGAGQGVQVIYQVGPNHAFAVDCLGHATLEMDLYVGRLIRSVCHGACPVVGVLGRFQPWVFQFSGLHAPAPEVLVGGEPAAVGVDREISRLTVLDLVIPAHAPIAYGCNDIDIRPESGDAYLQPDLVVALAGAAVGDGVSVVLPGCLDQIPGDERASQGRGQRVLLLVNRPGLQGREKKFVN